MSTKAWAAASVCLILLAQVNWTICQSRVPPWVTTQSLPTEGQTFLHLLGGKAVPYPACYTIRYNSINAIPFQVDLGKGNLASFPCTDILRLGLPANVIVDDFTVSSDLFREVLSCNLHDLFVELPNGVLLSYDLLCSQIADENPRISLPQLPILPDVDFDAILSGEFFPTKTKPIPKPIPPAPQELTRVGNNQPIAAPTFGNSQNSLPYLSQPGPNPTTPTFLPQPYVPTPYHSEPCLRQPCQPQSCPPQPCLPQPCPPQPCQPEPCSPQPCQPQPCPPQPCQSQPCPPQPCQPQPCPHQPCQPQPCPSHLCQPQPCPPQPCQPQPCPPQPCQPEPCPPQLCQPIPVQCPFQSGTSQPCLPQPCSSQPCIQTPLFEPYLPLSCSPEPCAPWFEPEPFSVCDHFIHPPISCIPTPAGLPYRIDCGPSPFTCQSHHPSRIHSTVSPCLSNPTLNNSPFGGQFYPNIYFT